MGRLVPKIFRQVPKIFVEMHRNKNRNAFQSSAKQKSFPWKHAPILPGTCFRYKSRAGHVLKTCNGKRNVTTCAPSERSYTCAKKVSMATLPQRGAGGSTCCVETSLVNPTLLPAVMLLSNHSTTKGSLARPPSSPSPKTLKACRAPQKA